MIMNTIVLRLSVVMACILLAGCTTFNNLSTGRSLGKGVHEITPSLSSYYVEGKATTPSLPQVIYNYGLTEKLDIGANVSFGMFGGQVKYQLIGDQQSFFCMAPGITYTYFDAGTSNGNSADRLNFSLSNLSLPINMSVHPSERLAVYFSPKVLRLGGRAALGSNNSSSYIMMIGFTPGVEYGRRIKVIAEVNILSPLKTNDNFKHTFGMLSLGAKFRL
jgi:hypothetical protein